MKEITDRLDKIIVSLGVISKPESSVKKVVDGIIAIVTITGIISVIDILKNWIGG